MRQSGNDMIQVPRAMISGWMFALFPGLMVMFNIIDEPGLHGVRGPIILRLITIGFSAGIFFCGLILFIRSKWK